ncbi:hypothetical protein [Methylomonas sp. AM2-LC]|uniref:hypothetical protein n=1 Tax=Methylomonas sp. AM2-LC TaxID=3153301 RepID=UPI0032653B64
MTKSSLSQEIRFFDQISQVNEVLSNEPFQYQKANIPGHSDKPSLISQLNKITRNRGFHLMSAIAAQRVIEHVQDGGFIGVNADHYAMALLDATGKVTKSGYEIFTNQQRSEAYQIAEEFWPEIYEQSKVNFSNASHH